ACTRWAAPARGGPPGPSSASRTRRVQRSMASDLISKLLAAGLSAGVFLIWWPEHHATAGLASLVVRGALWTLTYELLLVAFTPLERLARRAISARAHRLRPPNPFAAVHGPARVGGACGLA